MDKNVNRDPGESNRFLIQGILEEMKFWLRSILEHLKFHRGGIDPSGGRFFRSIQEFTTALEQFYSQVADIPDSATNQAILQFRDRAIGMTLPILNLKKEMAEGIATGRVPSIIHTELAHNFRSQTEYFISMLNYSRGEKTAARSTLGISQNRDSAMTVPRRMFYILKGEELRTAALDQIRFFCKSHYEHAQFISNVVIPDVKPHIREEAIKCQELFKESFENAVRVKNSGNGFEELVNEVHQNAVVFREFAALLNDSLNRKTGSSRQINTWPLLSEHIYREADYFADITRRLSVLIKEEASESDNQ